MIWETIMSFLKDGYIIWGNTVSKLSHLHTLSPSFIAFTSSRSPSLSNSRLSGFGECLFFLHWPCSSRNALLFALFSASSLVSNESNNRCCCRWLYVCLVASMVSQSIFAHCSWICFLSALDLFLFSHSSSAWDSFTWTFSSGTLVCATAKVTPNVFSKEVLIFS